MLVMVVFFIAFRWIHLSTPLIRLFLLVLILLLMPTLNFLPGWFALSLLRFLFFSSRRRHTRCSRDWSQTCALPIFTCNRMLKRLGCAFSISSSTSTEYGVLLTASVNRPPWSNPTYPGGAPMSRETVWLSAYSLMS